MKKEINLYDVDMNFIKTFQSVEECAEFFDKEKNYIHHNLKYRDKIRKDDKWYKIRRIIRDEKQEIIDELYDFVNWHYEDNKKFYKNGIGLNYPECDYILKKLLELKEKKNDKNI